MKKIITLGVLLTLILGNINFTYANNIVANCKVEQIEDFDGSFAYSSLFINNKIYTIMEGGDILINGKKTYTNTYNAFISKNGDVFYTNLYYGNEEKEIIIYKNGEKIYSKEKKGNINMGNVIFSDYGSFVFTYYKELNDKKEWYIVLNGEERFVDSSTGYGFSINPIFDNNDNIIYSLKTGIKDKVKIIKGNEVINTPYHEIEDLQILENGELAYLGIVKSNVDETTNLDSFMTYYLVIGNKASIIKSTDQRNWIFYLRVSPNGKHYAVGYGGNNLSGVGRYKINKYVSFTIIKDGVIADNIIFESRDPWNYSYDIMTNDGNYYLLDKTGALWSKNMTQHNLPPFALNKKGDELKFIDGKMLLNGNKIQGLNHEITTLAFEGKKRLDIFGLSINEDASKIVFFEIKYPELEKYFKSNVIDFDYIEKNIEKFEKNDDFKQIEGYLHICDLKSINTYTLTQKEQKAVEQIANQLNKVSQAKRQNYKSQLNKMLSQFKIGSRQYEIINGVIKLMK